MKIKVFSHAIDLNNDTNITLEQTKLLESTGLLDASQEVNMMLHFQEDSFSWLKERWKDRKNVNYFVFDESYKEWYESTTMQHIQNLVHSTDDEFYVLYISHKGVSHPPGGHQNWRRFMQYWNIEKWNECVEKLDQGYDTCGAAFLFEEPYAPFYAGNFFWAKSSYLRKCKKLKSPPDCNYTDQFGHGCHHRFDQELWHGSGNPNWYDMYPCERNDWYNDPETNKGVR